MVRQSISSLALVAFLLSGLAVAHPGHDIQNELAQRAAYFARAQYTNLDHCAGKLKERQAETIARRSMTVDRLRTKRALKPRDRAEVVATSHHSNLTVDTNSPHELLFGDNATCLLSPEVTEGPYYVGGEFVRSNITEDQAGVPLTVDLQIIDVTTCEPLDDVALELWHCGATGVYGGVTTEDPTNINSTALRGIQFSGSDGVVEFDTIYPGHYTGRTIHAHILAHINATILPNATITGGTASHVGQIYFDQDLNDLVETTAPYTSNTMSITKNAQDRYLNVGASGENDPVNNYVLLGDDITDGVFAWITFGLDPAAVRPVHEAAHYGENGGVPNRDGGRPSNLLPPA